MRERRSQPGREPRWPPELTDPVPILDAEGELAGFVPLEEFSRPPPHPGHGTGGRAPRFSKPVEVNDANGKITGYLLPGYGRFVPLEVARDPDKVNRLQADPSLVIRGGELYDSGMKFGVIEGKPAMLPAPVAQLLTRFNRWLRRRLGDHGRENPNSA